MLAVLELLLRIVTDDLAALASSPAGLQPVLRLIRRTLVRPWRIEVGLGEGETEVLACLTRIAPASHVGTATAPSCGLLWAAGSCRSLATSSALCLPGPRVSSHPVSLVILLPTRQVAFLTTRWATLSMSSQYFRRPALQGA